MNIFRNYICKKKCIEDSFPILFLVKFWPLLQFLNLIKYFLICLIQIWRILLLYYLNARNLVDEVVNQLKMIFWFNHKKNNLKYIANYRCILYLKFLWYPKNKLLWDRLNQQNHENKIRWKGWKKFKGKNLSKMLIRILYIKHSLLQEIKVDNFLTTIKSTQKLINAIVTKVSF